MELEDMRVGIGGNGETKWILNRSKRLFCRVSHIRSLIGFRLNFLLNYSSSHGAPRCVALRTHERLNFVRTIFDSKSNIGLLARVVSISISISSIVIEKERKKSEMRRDKIRVKNPILFAKGNKRSGGRGEKKRVRGWSVKFCGSEFLLDSRSKMSDEAK